MHELRLHGRAGQGILTASRLFAQSAILDGKYAQAFPDFGPERLGSPVAAFARIDSQPIEIRSQVYEPDAVVVFEQSLLTKVPVAKGIPPKGKIVVNCSEKGVSQLQELAEASDLSAHFIDADRIALEIIGSRTVSTIMLGALASSSGFVSLESLESAVAQRFRDKKREANMKMVRLGFKEVKQA